MTRTPSHLYSKPKSVPVAGHAFDADASIGAIVCGAGIGRGLLRRLPTGLRLLERLGIWRLLVMNDARSAIHDGVRRDFRPEIAALVRAFMNEQRPCRKSPFRRSSYLC